MRRLLLLITCLSAAATAQVPIALPNYQNPAGQPRNVPAFIPVPIGVVPTDGSGTLTNGGASQTVFAARPTRSLLICQNPITATEPLFLNFGAAASTAGGSIELAPGGSVTLIGAAVPATSVTTTAATTGHRFVCKEG